MKYLMYSSILVYVINSCTPLEETEEKQIESQVIPTSEVKYRIDDKQSAFTWIISSNWGKLDGYLKIEQAELRFDTASTDLAGEFSILISSLKVSKDQATKSAKRITNDSLPISELLQVDSFPAAKIEIVSTSITREWAPQEIEEVTSAYSPEPYTSFMLIDYTHIVKIRIKVGGVSKELIVPARISLQENDIRLESRFNIDGSSWPLFENTIQKIEFANTDDFIHKTLNVGLFVTANRVSN